MIAFAAMCDSGQAAETATTIRQVIIRAPELRVLTALMKSADDEALTKTLLGWVAEGHAKIVSDVSGPLGDDRSTVVRSGKQFKNAIEYDQDFDRGAVVPVDWDPVFVGSSLEAQVSGPRSAHYPCFATWSASFSPREELAVTWPAWWPEVPNPMVNWFDKHDFYVEKLITTAEFMSQDAVVLGVMRRPDCLGDYASNEETLDVVIAQVISDPKAGASGKVAGRHGYSAHAKITVLGFGLKDVDALTLLNRPDLKHDQAILDELMAQAIEGKVKVRACCALNQFNSCRTRLESVREHSYPTEMPTIPSAWEMRPMGTILESEYTFPSGVTLAFEHHSALPRRAEWQCALDMPALIMWLPQFFVQKITTTSTFGSDGVVLLGAMRTPDCIAGAKEMPAGETLLLFAKLDQTAPIQSNQTPADPFAPDQSPADSINPNKPPASFEPPPPRIEMEAVVFEVPAGEEPLWQSDPAAFDDGDRYLQLINRTKNATAKIVAHLTVAVKPGVRATISNVEEVRTVTEIDPPRKNSPQCYRPTAMAAIPCGTSWEVEPVMEASANPFDHGELEVHLSHTLTHHVAVPIEPSCKQVIEAARRNELDRLPKAQVFDESWKGRASLKFGLVRLIGVQHPPGDAFEDKLHIAFLRARIAE